VGVGPFGVPHQSIGTFGDDGADDDNGEGKDSVFFNVYAWIGCSGFFGKDVKEYGFEWGKLKWSWCRSEWTTAVVHTRGCGQMQMKPSTTRQQCR